MFLFLAFLGNQGFKISLHPLCFTVSLDRSWQARKWGAVKIAWLEVRDLLVFGEGK